MKRDHDQGNLQKEAFNWGLAYSLRGLVHEYPGREHGGQQV